MHIMYPETVIYIVLSFSKLFMQQHQWWTVGRRDQLTVYISFWKIIQDANYQFLQQHQARDQPGIQLRNAVILNGEDRQRARRRSSLGQVREAGGVRQTGRQTNDAASSPGWTSSAEEDARRRRRHGPAARSLPMARPPDRHGPCGALELQWQQELAMRSVR
jgi:hypothetical protein